MGCRELDISAYFKLSDQHGRSSTLRWLPPSSPAMAGLSANPNPDTYSYNYLPNSNLASSVSLSVASVPSVMSVNNTYESNRNLIKNVENKFGSTTISKYDYVNDAIGRRTSMAKPRTAFTASDTINYTYNDKSEVTSAVSANSADYNFAFTFDQIGNRTTYDTTESGSNVQSAYTSNNLNQYTNITNPNQAPTHDADGNMLTATLGTPSPSSAWSFTYNAENRVIVAESASSKLEFTYDYMGRRVEKKVYSGSTGSWSLDKHLKFVYDNYVQIEELDGLNSSAIAKRRIWSGGKIICDIHGTSFYYAIGDANKNITEYVDGSGSIQAHHEYSPFGKITASNGAMVDDFDYRFSSEMFDGETGLVYYNFRMYSPELGRWLSRDPIGERGGYNLYGMVGNNAVGAWDLLGNAEFDWGSLYVLLPGLGTVYNMIVDPLGSDASHYSINLDPDSCCQGGAFAQDTEKNCKNSVTKQGSAYIIEYSLMNLAHEVIDAFGALTGFWVPFAIDAFLDFATSLYKINRIFKGRDAAYEKCVCPAACTKK